MKAFQNFLTDVEAFVKDVQRIKSEGAYSNEDMAALAEYGMSLN